jgi:hypothetical protein
MPSGADIALDAGDLPGLSARLSIQALDAEEALVVAGVRAFGVAGLGAELSGAELAKVSVRLPALRTIRAAPDRAGTARALLHAGGTIPSVLALAAIHADAVHVYPLDKDADLVDLAAAGAARRRGDDDTDDPRDPFLRLRAHVLADVARKSRTDAYASLRMRAMSALDHYVRIAVHDRIGRLVSSAFAIARRHSIKTMSLLAGRFLMEPLVAEIRRRGGGVLVVEGTACSALLSSPNYWLALMQARLPAPGAHAWDHGDDVGDPPSLAPWEAVLLPFIREAEAAGLDSGASRPAADPPGTRLEPIDSTVLSTLRELSTAVPSARALLGPFLSIGDVPLVEYRDDFPMRAAYDAIRNRLLVRRDARLLSRTSLAVLIGHELIHAADHRELAAVAGRDPARLGMVLAALLPRAVYSGLMFTLEDRAYHVTDDLAVALKVELIPEDEWSKIEPDSSTPSEIRMRLELSYLRAARKNPRVWVMTVGGLVSGGLTPFPR